MHCDAGVQPASQARLDPELKSSRPHAQGRQARAPSSLERRPSAGLTAAQRATALSACQQPAAVAQVAVILSATRPVRSLACTSHRLTTTWLCNPHRRQELVVGFQGRDSHRQERVTCCRLPIRCRRRVRLLQGTIRFRVDSDRRAERLVSWTHGGMSYSGNLIRRIISRSTVFEAVQPPHRAVVSSAVMN
jgi:hypothetical protein